MARSRNHPDISFSMCIVSLILIGAIVVLSIAIVNANKKKTRNHRIQEIGLANFCVSNLNITDNQISGDWTIGLNLINPARKATVYTDIEFTVALSTVPNVTIVDFHLGYPLRQHSDNRTTVYLHGSAENLPVNSQPINGGVVEFDVVGAAKTKNVDMLDAGRLVLTCHAIEVSPVNASGCANGIPVCDLVKRRVYDL